MIRQKYFIIDYIFIAYFNCSAKLTTLNRSMMISELKNNVVSFLRNYNKGVDKSNYASFSLIEDHDINSYNAIDNEIWVAFESNVFSFQYNW